MPSEYANHLSKLKFSHQRNKRSVDLQSWDFFNGKVCFIEVFESKREKTRVGE